MSTFGKAQARDNPGSFEVADLVLAAAGGDQGAWNQLVERFADTVWAIARSHRLSPADAADVSQTTWLRLVEHLGRLEQPERVGAWLATTARRESLRTVRLAARQIPTGELVPEPAGNQPAVDTRLMIEMRDETFNALVDRLPLRCQLMLRLLSAESPLSYRDLSAALEMPIGSLGPTRARCLEHLRRIALRAGLSSADLAPNSILD